MKKKAVSVICAFAMTACCLPMQAQAKVIKPEVVKTEKWTTSYYIDDDTDTLYPYIQCEADIYNDGTIKLYMWNTHEWDGFATVKHRVTIVQPEPTQENTDIYNIWCDLNGKTVAWKDPITSVQATYLDKTIDLGNLDLSYYPQDYSYKGMLPGSDIFNNHASITIHGNKSPSTSHNYTSSLSIKEYYGALSEIPAKATNERKDYYCFQPKVDPTGTYNFRLYGHNITITPELLSGNIIATPQLTEQEKYVKQLEEENAALKAENEQLKSQISILSKSKFCDVNQDGIVDVKDAQLVLIYYTESVAGLTDDTPIEIWYTKRNTTAG